MSDTAHILVVDDDVEIRDLLSEYLQENGFLATAVADAEQTRRALGQGGFDLVVLDLMLPRESGFEICRELRTHSSIPIIMLTALGDEADRVAGLEIGADDYVPKPFSPRELLGRIRAVLRRTSIAQRAPDTSGCVYRFAGWALDMTTRSLRGPNGRTVGLSGAEFQLLSTLLEQAPALVTRKQLMERMRGRALDPLDRSIHTRVSRLRQTLGDDARASQIIRTVYGEGYMISVPIERDER